MDKNKQKIKELMDNLRVAQGHTRHPETYDFNKGSEIQRSKGRGSQEIIRAIEKIVRFLIGITLKQQKQIDDLKKNITK